YNGYLTSTEEASYAWISLDSEKLAKLDAVSETQVRKNGKKLEILLNSGNLYFDISEPLTEEETLNIRTSTMVMGIRGTSGWVKVIDRWHSQVYILEGTVQCSVMDPVTNQIKSTTLTSGQMAEFVVYSQDQPGDKCDILMQSYTEGDIDGFALVELVQDRSLCGQILDASGLDILGLAGDAQQRLLADQAEMSGSLEGINSRLADQESYISQDPVWTGGALASDSQEGDAGDDMSDTAEGTEDGSSPGSGGGGSSASGQTADGQDSGAVAVNGDTQAGSDTPSSGGTSSGTGGSSSGESSTPETPGSTTPDTPAQESAPVTLNPADGITAGDVNEQLSQENVNQVVVQPDPAGENSTLTVNSGSTMNIPSEKTLTVEEGAALNVEEGATVEVDGTLDIKGDLVNNGTIIVNQGG
ncbi:MAG: FecR family protein, partial [Lachnospiraceae bacterium]|nr:FecR family protein [Lachnospiraceae bacterium]